MLSYSIRRIRMEKWKNLLLQLFLCAIFPVFSISAKPIPEKRMVVVIPSYKNEKWVEKNLTSVLTQKYSNFRVIYIDDLSPDQTYMMVKRTVENFKAAGKVSVLQNSIRKGALQNLYEAIHSCSDDEIIVTLDGDDWFPNKTVLSYLNEIYSRKTPVWLTHGTYISSHGAIGLSRSASKDTIKRNAFRTEFQPSHLRTFYAWLFKRIKKEDLLYKGEFFPMAWDLAMMYPMLEMAGSRHAFISKVMYIYNVDNPISDWKKDESFQFMLDQHIRKKERYSPI